MRILTKKISETLSAELIELIWTFYDEQYIGITMDDYQFFKISTDDDSTTIKMWQEIPSAIKVKKIPYFPDNEIWIVKDGDVQTMLFPSEY